jgi:hypothetical protein
MHHDTTLASVLKGTGSGKTKVMKFSMTQLLVYKREALGTERVGNNYHTGQTGQSTS